MKNVFSKKVLLSILIINFFSVYAQIRDYVGVVRPVISSQTVSFLKDFQNELKAKGYNYYASEIDNYLAGGFGSGFIYVNEAGNNFVITNRHVIGDSKTATLELENPDTGAITKFENLSVVAFDDEIDVAILSFANGAKPFKKGLSFSTVKTKDGMEVYSAGFPGLAGKPLWQLGKGIVTNSSARIKELLNPDISVLIQHSAEVDGGNSGGPLLIAAKNSIGYEVAGINTWKATYRQNTNFAIPSKIIADFVVSGKLPTEEERAAEIKALLDNPDSEYIEIAKYISMDTVMENGRAAFIDALKFSPTAVRNTVISVFEQSPVEAMKYAIAYDLKNDIKPKKEKAVDYSSKNKNEVVKFMGIKSDYILGIILGTAVGFGDADLGFGLSGAFQVWPYTCFGMEANITHYFTDSLNVVNFGPVLGLPLDFNRFTIVPLAKVEIGLSFMRDARFTQGLIEGGAEVLFNGENVEKYGFGITYSYSKYKLFSNTDVVKVDLDKKSVSAINVYGKVNF